MEAGHEHSDSQTLRQLSVLVENMSFGDEPLSWLLTQGLCAGLFLCNLRSRRGLIPSGCARIFSIIYDDVLYIYIRFSHDLP